MPRKPASAKGLRAVALPSPKTVQFQCIFTPIFHKKIAQKSPYFHPHFFTKKSPKKSPHFHPTNPFFFSPKVLPKPLIPHPKKRLQFQQNLASKITSIYLPNLVQTEPYFHLKHSLPPQKKTFSEFARGLSRAYRTFTFLGECILGDSY